MSVLYGVKFESPHTTTAADAGSIYDPYPTFTYVYDPNAPNNKHKRSLSRSTARGHSFELSPHPADPYASMFAAANGSFPTISPNAIYRHVHGEELWVYAGVGGCVDNVHAFIGI